MAGVGGGATVECPRCGTSYRVSEAAVEGGQTTYQCAKCHEVFGPGAADDDGWRDEPEDDAFAFDDEAPPSRRSERRKRPAREPEPEAGDDDPDESDLEDEDDSTDDETPPPARASARPRRRARAVPDDEPPPPGVARFALRCLIAVTLGYAIVSIWASTHHTEFQRMLADVPLVGSRIAETAMDPGDVALRDVSGTYAYLKSGELAFVVHGTAVNLSNGPLRRVRVEGRVSGAEERRHVVSCTDAPSEVHKTSRQMLILMENVREARPPVLAPGASAACDVVFVDPPKDVRELSLEIVSVLAN